jgi:hypothetical protein
MVPSRATENKRSTQTKCEEAKNIELEETA